MYTLINALSFSLSFSLSYSRKVTRTKEFSNSMKMPSLSHVSLSKRNEAFAKYDHESSIKSQDSIVSKFVHWLKSLSSLYGIYLLYI